MDSGAEFGLVMPFVTVASVGGPHDDNSYVCGYEVGEWSAKLAPRVIAATSAMVHTENLPQLDLVAMHHGYMIELLADHGEWTHLGFTRDDSEAPG